MNVKDLRVGNLIGIVDGPSTMVGDVVAIITHVEREANSKREELWFMPQAYYEVVHSESPNFEVGSKSAVSGNSTEKGIGWYSPEKL